MRTWSFWPIPQFPALGSIEHWASRMVMGKDLGRRTRSAPVLDFQLRRIELWSLSFSSVDHVWRSLVFQKRRSQLEIVSCMKINAEGNVDHTATTDKIAIE